MLPNSNRKNLGSVAEGKFLPSGKEFLFIILTFVLTVFSWIFFRAENLGHALCYISEILSPSIFLFPQFSNMYDAFITIILIGVFVIIEWLGRGGQYAISEVGRTMRTPVRYAFYYLLVFAIYWFGGEEQQFIYFQF